MSIYDKASLVLIPSGTKTSKVYSQKPTNGDGDFTFSRSTAATRVNASGNIEKETQNLLNYSNTLDNAAWKQSGSVTGGQTDRNGGSDAWIVSSVLGSALIGYQTITLSGVYTFSMYVKINASNGFGIGFGSLSNAARFDISDTTKTSAVTESGLISSSQEYVGNNFYRLSVTANMSGSTQMRMYLTTADGTASDTTGGTQIVQDAQVEQGLVARDYIETTTTAIYGGITDNVPRLDYTDSSCPALLLEPQRTNKIGNSEFINNDSSWYEANGADCTPNYALSPEGVNNATRVKLDNSGAFSLTRIYHDFVPDASNDTASFYAKSNTGSSFDIVIYFRDSGFGAVRGSKTITITNEWQRFDLTADCSGAAGNVMFLIYNTTASENWDFLMYGAQVEAGSYATSYIPTYGSAVTRNADDINQQVSSLTSLEQGTFFVDFDRGVTSATSRDASTDGLFYRSGNSFPAANAIEIATDLDGKVRVLFRSPLGVLILDLQNATDRYKMLYKWSGDSLKLYVNGNLEYNSAVKWGEVTSALEYIGYNADFRKSVNQIMTFPTALTDQEAIDLTTI